MALRNVMPESVRQHVHAALFAFAMIAGVSGALVFWAAVTLAQYLAAVVIFAIAGAFVLAARLVDAEQTARDLESLANHNSRTSAKDATDGGESKRSAI